MEIEKSEILKQNTMVLEAQVEERPLAKKQEALQEASAEGSQPSDAQAADPGLNGSTGVSQEQVKKEKVAHKALLKNDDVELNRVRKVRVIISPK